MSEWPLIVVMLLTYKRVGYALRAIRSTKENLIYPNLKWFVADNGTDLDGLRTILDEIGGGEVIGSCVEKSPEGTFHCGKCWNKATLAIYEHADILLRLEDDWAINQHLDIRPYARLLRTLHMVGMIRFGYQHDHADMRVVCYEGIHYLRYEKTTPFVHGGHPSMIHRRYHEIYGMYHEGRNPGEIEIEFDERMRKIDGPQVLRPMSIGGWGAWVHFGEEKAYR